MRIVMVCTGNTCRSPMAEALMRRALAERGIDGVEVSSAGTSAWGGDPASADAVREMARQGIDISGHRSRRVDARMLDGALVLCMTESHLRAARNIAPDADAHALMDYAGLPGEVPDPIGMGEDEYARCAELLRAAIEVIADQFGKGM